MAKIPCTKRIRKASIKQTSSTLKANSFIYNSGWNGRSFEICERRDKYKKTSNKNIEIYETKKIVSLN